MKLPRTAAAYRDEVLKYSDRSYTKTIYQGFIYRFLKELLNKKETDINEEFPDLNDHILGQLATFHADEAAYIRGHAYLGDQDFLIEQDISITVETDGEGWSDVGSRDLSQSQDFHWFLDHLKSCSKSGLRWILLLPSAILGVDSEIQHPLPSLAEGPVDPNHSRDGSLVQSSSHLPRDYPLLLDHSIAALDPLYALSPIFRFAAATSSHLLGNITRRYELISSTIWDPRHSKAYLEQLILHKHLLDDHAARHEQVLRYLRSPHLARWATQLNREQRRVATKAKQAVLADFEYLLARSRTYAEHHHVAINILTSASALNESRKQIDLATQVTKLTVLASVFLPLSFCTGLFGMNFRELEGLSIWIWAVVTVAIGVVTLVVYGWDEVGRWIGGVRRRKGRGRQEMEMELDV
ncbi:hypothetical protein DE146DRAFT_622527 [Phaeosphaeria sp. MPI-PUGE-AT-0046c]|nr:hypothetical protein DE146DRAFT_622527 [Phaeosphaeria sp. MPI-PUGE-AT-0046c]